ncbi:MAG TPA: tetratricopeptide repeat protein [Bacteroidota bacterium]|nr:tetratricopeptide repeat protein [Bacteroidota bacterium]
MKRAFPFLLLLLIAGGCQHDRRLSTQSQPALEAYRAGLTQSEQFDYTGAKSSFERAVAGDSLFAMAWLRLGLVHLQIEDLSRATECVDRAMALSADASKREQLFIRMWYYRLHFNAGAAAATADSLAMLYPDEKEVYLFRGNLYEQAKNFDAAIRCYQKAVQADTGYALAVMTLGYAYSNIGDRDKAIAQMQRYIQLAPKEPDPRASYADILVRAGRFDEALEQYRQSLLIKPDYWYSVREIGNIDAIKGMLREAETQYHTSFGMLPRNRQLEATESSVEGRLALLRGKPEEAAARFRDALAVDTLNVDAAFGYVHALARSGRVAEAGDVLRRIQSELGRRGLLTSPSMAGYYLSASVVRMYGGDLTGALVMCDSGFAYSTTQARAAIYRQMAEVNLRQHAFDDGLSACEEALALSPNSPDILLTLVRLYAASGDHRLAGEIGRRLLDFWKNADPDFAPRNEVLKLLSQKIS